MTNPFVPIWMTTKLESLPCDRRSEMRWAISHGWRPTAASIEILLSESCSADLPLSTTESPKTTTRPCFIGIAVEGGRAGPDLDGAGDGVAVGSMSTEVIPLKTGSLAAVGIGCLPTITKQKMKLMHSVMKNPARSIDGLGIPKDFHRIHVFLMAPFLMGTSK